MASIASLRKTVQCILLLCTLIVLAVSAHVNSFMGFFYVADRFPFIMSILTVVIVGLLVVLEHIHSGDVRTARPVLELPCLGALLITWTGANAFSTSRWRNVQPSDCAAIPVEQNPAFYGPARTWCQEIQALRALIWIEWVILALTFMAILGFALLQSKQGSSHVWTTPMGCYDPMMAPSSQWKGRYGGSSGGQDVEEKGDRYVFDMQTEAARQAQTQPTPTRASTLTTVLRGPDPFNSSVEPSVPSPEQEPYFMPTTWQAFAEQDQHDHNGQAVYEQQYGGHYANVERHQYQQY